MVGKGYWNTINYWQINLLYDIVNQSYSILATTLNPFVPLRPVKPIGPGEPINPGGPCTPSGPFRPFSPLFPVLPFGPCVPFSPSVQEILNTLIKDLCTYTSRLFTSNIRLCPLHI